jgi:predicted MFS family arabinose efflux permease
MPLPSGLRALAHADYRRFAAAQLVSQVGSWMQSVAQSWLVLQLTPSPFKLGLIGTLQFGPILLLSIAAGALADRVPKRKLLITTQTVQCGYSLALAALVASGHVQYWHVAVLACTTGIVGALDGPARQSFVADLVGPRDVGSAVALNSASFNAARIVGPALGGLLIAGGGVVPAFLANAAALLLAILALTRLRTDGAPRAGRGAGVLAEIAEGLAYIRRTREILLALGLLTAVSFCVFNFSVYVPLIVRTVLHIGAEGFGFLMAALGVGAVAGALAVGVMGTPPRGLLVAAAALACAGLFSLAFARHFWVAAPILTWTGFFGIILVAGANTTLQLAAPDELRGRVMSVYTLVWGGAFPVGAFVVGAISERWGVGRALLVQGLGGLAVVGALLAWWRSGPAPVRR